MADLNFNVNQYSTFRTTMTFSGSGVDLVNWEFSGSIKESYKKPAITNFIIEKDIPNSRITVTLLPYQTGLLVKPEYLYDIIVTNIAPNPDEVYRIVEGKILVDPGVTESNVGAP
jgi:hypothetical protein